MTKEENFKALTKNIFPCVCHFVIFQRLNNQPLHSRVSKKIWFRLKTIEKNVSFTFTLHLSTFPGLDIDTIKWPIHSV